MSAWIVSKKHIDTLITVAQDGPSDRVGRHPGDGWIRPYYNGPQPYADADEIGKALWLENQRSVAYRYPNDKDGQWPGPAGLTLAEIEGYQHQRGQSVTIVEAIKACDCYEYQSCEHPAWEQSAAKRFINQIRRACICALPGYDDAPWGID